MKSVTCSIFQSFYVCVVSRRDLNVSIGKATETTNTHSAPLHTPWWYQSRGRTLAGTLDCPELVETRITAKKCGKQHFYQVQAGREGAIERFL